MPIFFIHLLVLLLGLLQGLLLVTCAARHATCCPFPRRFFLYTIYIIYLFLAVLDPLCCVGFSAAFSLVMVCGLLIAVASLVVEHRLSARSLQ